MEKVEQGELFDEIIMTLMAALSLAGVRDEKMSEALDAYQAALEKIDDDKECDYRAIRDIILSLKTSNPELF